MTYFADAVEFCVADPGVGILRPLLARYPDLKSHADAIDHAVKQGVTRGMGQGNGLTGTLRIAQASKGWLCIGSGTGLVAWDQTGRTEYTSVDERKRFDGTWIACRLRTDVRLRLEDVLGFGVPRSNLPLDIIDYEDEDPNEPFLAIRLADEAEGVGSRQSGRRMRTLCANMLRARPELPLVLDWSGVEVISSSFADEFLGKLFVELGPLTFGGRVRNLKMSGTVRHLIDTAVFQRAAQALQASLEPGAAKK